VGRKVVEDKVLSCKSGVSRDRGAITLEKAGAGKGVHVAAGSENKEEYEKCSLVALLLWCAAVVCSLSAVVRSLSAVVCSLAARS